MINIRDKTKRHISHFVNEKHATNMEISIYNSSIRFAKEHEIVNSWEDSNFTHVYLQKSTNILTFLKDDDFVNKILNKEIDCKTIGNIEASDIFASWNPKHFKDENVEEGIFQCRKCKSRKTEYYSLQTRSADEPMTNFITCLNCKNRWKM